MCKSWSFANPVNIHFGRNSRKILLDELLGMRCLVVTTERGRQQIENDAMLSSIFGQINVEWVDTISPNPNVLKLQELINCFTNYTFDTVIAFGGGSVIDSAKVLSVALSLKYENAQLIDLLEAPEIHNLAKPHPLYALPTTAGTGSEVTPFATVWDDEKKKKYSFAGSSVFAHTAIIDPSLTDDLPLDVTLTTGLDAINQALESIWNHNATSLTIGFAAKAVQLGIEALPKLIAEGGSKIDRDKMAECSLLAGLAISQTRTALCHSISYPLTSHFSIPHGLACAFTMLDVLSLNLSCDDGRFTQLAKYLGYGSVVRLEERLAMLVQELNVAKRVRGYIPSLEALKALLPEMITPGRAENNLAPFNTEIICRILEDSYARV